MEGHELQGDDAEDALQTVHCLWQLNSLVGILSHVRVILATEDDGPALIETETQTRFTFIQTHYQLLHFICALKHMSSVPVHVEYVRPELTDLAVTCCSAFWHLL